MSQVVTVTFLFGLSFLSPVFASSTIVISEIAYDLPGSDDHHEWIELHNDGAADIDLTGWKFNNGTNHLLSPPPQKGGQGSLTLAPGDFAILADDALTFLADHPGFSGTVIDTVLELVNSEATLALIDTEGLTVISVTYASSMGASGNGRTLDLLDGTFHESAVEGGTPGINSSPLSGETLSAPPPPPASPPPPPAVTTPAPSPHEESPAPPLPSTPHKSVSTLAQVTTLRLSELLPNPVGRDSENEYVELFNFGKVRMDLTGWKILNSKKASLTLSGFLDGGAFLILKADDFSLPSLTNSGDTVELLDPTGIRRDGIRYEKVEEGQALARTSDGASWYWTSQPTPGIANSPAALADAIADDPSREGIIIALAPSPSSPKEYPSPENTETPPPLPSSTHDSLKKQSASSLSALEQAPTGKIDVSSGVFHHPFFAAVVLSLFSGVVTLVLRIWGKRRRSLEFEVEEP